LVCVCVCVGPFQAARENRGRHATISPMNWLLLISWCGGETSERKQRNRGRYDFS
jgi:hypothetical protein